MSQPERLQGCAPEPNDPPAPASLAALGELIAVVDRLRDPEGGCPWDLEQTHATLIPYVLEEAHEVADAIRCGDDTHLVEELGDLLLQVVLHARIASEDGRFDLETIARAISAKLIRRHPHVFADAKASDSAAVRRHWEAIKAQEAAEAQAASRYPATMTCLRFIASVSTPAKAPNRNIGIERAAVTTATAKPMGATEVKNFSFTSILRTM